MKQKPQPDFIRGEFFLAGVIPGKANRRRNGINRKTGKAITFLPTAITAALTYLQLQARAKWAGNPPVTQAYVHYEFHVSRLGSDADNRAKSLSDVLTKAGILCNDSDKHIRELRTTWQKVLPGKEGVMVRIEGVACKDKPRTSRRAA